MGLGYKSPLVHQGQGSPGLQPTNRGRVVSEKDSPPPTFEGWNMLVKRWDNESPGWLTWTALAVGGAANIAAAPPTWTGRLVAARSPICLATSYELLLQQLPHRKTSAAGTHHDGHVA